MRFEETWIHMANFGENRLLGRCRKVIAFCWQKKSPASQDTSEPQFCPT